jgi:beta-phosphoglucomutase-like phosphatase (HAD superfamily)
VTLLQTRALEGVDVVLCDADGNLFASEEPAFEASAEITNRFLASLGSTQRYLASELRRTTTGRNFRSTAAELARAHGRVGFTRSELDRWIREERDEVTAHLRRALEPDAEVRRAVERLATRGRVALVSSSARVRVDACLEASELADLFPPEVRFSAEDSLSEPRSKPDPAIYEFAIRQLGVGAGCALAIEDAAPGVLSAVGAGVQTIGNLHFVATDERDARRAELVSAGAFAVVDSWQELLVTFGETVAAY